jgi:nucleoside-diphosphate-sugar epimerase
MRELAAKNKRVRIVNRRGKADAVPGVEVVRGDAMDAASTREACKGAAVVYNCANPAYTEWVTLFPRIQAGILEGAAAAGAKLIAAENVYMYGPVDRPMTEDMPYAAHTRKGQVRAQMALTLQEAHRAGKVLAASGRAADFYGPGVLSSAVGERVFFPALRGKAATVMGKLDVLHTYSFIDDFARGLVILGERPEALGQAWHIPSAETLTTRQFLTLVYAELKLPLKVSAAPDLLIKALGLFNPMMHELVEMLYEFNAPFIVDHSKFARAFGDFSTPHAAAIRATVEWYRGQEINRAQGGG